MQNQVYKGQLFECQQIFLQKEPQKMSNNEENKSLKNPSQPSQQTRSGHSQSNVKSSKDPINQNRSQISFRKQCNAKDNQSQMLGPQMICQKTHETQDRKQATVYETEVFLSDIQDSPEMRIQDSPPIETQEGTDSKRQCIKRKLSEKNEYQSSKYKILTEAQKQYLVKLAKETSLSHVVRKYHISRNNLIRWQKGCLRKKGAGRKVQSEDFEQKMVAYVKQLINQGIQPTAKIVRSKAKQLHQNPNFKASKGWYTRFLSRHINIFPSQDFP